LDDLRLGLRELVARAEEPGAALGAVPGAHAG
jgi:hypothetical protein